MSKVYTTTVAVYELDKYGYQAGKPHVYKKQTGTLEDAKKAQEDLLWEAVEIEGLDEKICEVETSIEVETTVTEYVDSDDLFMRVDVERTDSPSRFVQQSDWKPTIYAVDRESSRMTVSDTLADLEG